MQNSTIRNEIEAITIRPKFAILKYLNFIINNKFIEKLVRIAAIITKSVSHYYITAKQWPKSLIVSILVFFSPGVPFAAQHGANAHLGAAYAPSGR